MPLPGWRAVKIGDVASIVVPEDASDQGVQPIDSIAGVFQGDRYAVMFEYGPYRLVSDRADETGRRTEESLHRRTIQGRPAIETSRAVVGGVWTIARTLQIEDGDNTLLLRVSCVDEEACQMADALFDSVTFSDNLR